MIQKLYPSVQITLFQDVITLYLNLRHLGAAQKNPAPDLEIALDGNSDHDSHVMANEMAIFFALPKVLGTW
ncbi:unnamed protein product [Protopolystoma xenopodis]|uniref:Uncharacterized protein n=1 Tax=Protopolystoma xenopodis TaxID=117903 RepID=A0A3S5CKN6_9PLAT|nr:unnamed protein product [Protopolystoma xenopodis]